MTLTARLGSKYAAPGSLMLGKSVYAPAGIEEAISGLTPGADYVIRPVIHYTASAIPKVQVLDATNADAVITSMTLPDQTANLVLNGGFDSDTGSWTAGASATLSSVAGGSAATVCNNSTGQQRKGTPIRRSNLHHSPPIVLPTGTKTAWCAVRRVLASHRRASRFTVRAR